MSEFWAGGVKKLHFISAELHLQLARGGQLGERGLLPYFPSAGGFLLHYGARRGVPGSVCLPPTDRPFAGFVSGHPDLYQYSCWVGVGGRQAGNYILRIDLI